MIMKGESVKKDINFLCVNITVMLPLLFSFVDSIFCCVLPDLFYALAHIAI